MPSPPFLTVLGGGPAGLAAGHFARERAWSCRILEASDHVGGNCTTAQRGEFRFDLGAHRFHDKDAEVTAMVRALLGNDLKPVSAPSAICLEGRFLTFPPQAHELLRYLGAARFTAAASGALLARLTHREQPRTLEAFATRAYGPALARMFLLNYSEKLWGVPCSTLSPRVSGGRLLGLRPSALLHRARTAEPHLEGAFFYPAAGYGSIATRLAESCGPGTIRTSARITRLLHDGRRITHVEVNGQDRSPVDQVVATLPLGLAVKLFDPPLPAAVSRLAEAVRFRNVLLPVLFLDKPTVTAYATVYFPDAAVPFTRVSEPRNRSASMSPPGKTSLVVEIPCFADDSLWRAGDQAIVDSIKPALARIGWIDDRSLLDACIVRVPNAYPVLTTEAEGAASAIVEHLRRFSNLHLIGRNGLFHYGWLHTVVRMAKTLIDELPPPALAEQVSA